MIYEFVNVKDDREGLELFYRPAEAPKIDEEIDHGGKRWRRVVSLPSAVLVSFRPLVSNTAYRNDPAADNHDSLGRPVFNTQQELDRYKGRQKDDPTRNTIYTDD